MIRDREVGGSNPLAPTIKSYFYQLLTAASLGGLFFCCGYFVARNLSLYGGDHFLFRHQCAKFA